MPYLYTMTSTKRGKEKLMNFFAKMRQVFLQMMNRMNRMNRILKLISSSDWDAEANKVFENDLATSRTDSDLEDWDA